MSDIEVFYEPPLRRATDGAFQYATYGVQVPGKEIGSTQVKISDAAWEEFIRTAREQDPDLTDSQVGHLLGEYIATKIVDRLDRGEPLRELYDFVASGFRDGAFRLDSLNVQMFIRQRVRGDKN